MLVVGLGAGGHAKVVIEILRLLGGYEFAGLLDPKPELWGTEVLGIKVLGDDTLLNDLYQQGARCAFVGVGTVGDTRTRKKLYESAQAAGFAAAAAVHPRAAISESAQVGDGPTVMAGVIINAEARIGDNVIVNTGAIIEHDCLIGSHSHIATGARLAGAVHVAEGVHIGMGASIRQGLNVGRNAIVGAGAVVIEDVPEGTTVVGVPARILEKAKA
jgi:sugar O-acyltransferase (sialic acid O-acetyltransferase NeuD family)